MAKVSKSKNGILRVVCDCGVWVHEIYKDGDKIECESFEQKKETPPPPPPAPSKKKSFDIFSEEDDE